MTTMGAPDMSDAVSTDQVMVPIVRGRKIEHLSGAEVAEMVAEAAHVVADVGTGDARVPYRLARQHPDWLALGIDPAWTRMTSSSGRAIRPANRGGAANLLLVRASIESLPGPLLDVADEVLVLMPWGRLLTGVIQGEADICGGLRALAREGASLDVTVGVSIWREPIPVALRGLPELTPDGVEGDLADRWRATGWELDDAEQVPASKVDVGASSWTRRLDHRGTEQVLHLRAHAIPTPGDE